MLLKITWEDLNLYSYTVFYYYEQKWDDSGKTSEIRTASPNDHISLIVKINL